MYYMQYMCSTTHSRTAHPVAGKGNVLICTCVHMNRISLATRDVHDICTHRIHPLEGDIPGYRILQCTHHVVHMQYVMQYVHST